MNNLDIDDNDYLSTPELLKTAHRTYFLRLDKDISTNFRKFKGEREKVVNDFLRKAIMDGRL